MLGPNIEQQRDAAGVVIVMIIIIYSYFPYSMVFVTRYGETDPNEMTVCLCVTAITSNIKVFPY